MFCHPVFRCFRAMDRMAIHDQKQFSLLSEGDRIAFFDPRSMWPFQYRLGVPMIGEMADAMQSSHDHGLHHTYKA